MVSSMWFYDWLFSFYYMLFMWLVGVGLLLLGVGDGDGNIDMDFGGIFEVNGYFYLCFF